MSPPPHPFLSKTCLPCQPESPSLTLYQNRQNPIVTSQPTRIFSLIAPALAAEALQGLTANRVVGATKGLLSVTNTDVRQAMLTLPPETQQAVGPMFL